MTIIHLTKENFDSNVEDKNLVVLDFWAEWCGPCKTFSPVFEQVSERYPQAIFGKIDVEEQSELAADFNIRAIPTIMILRQNVVVFAESSVLPASGLCTLIDQALALDMSTVGQQ